MIINLYIRGNIQQCQYAFKTKICRFTQATIIIPVPLHIQNSLLISLYYIFLRWHSPRLERGCNWRVWMHHQGPAADRSLQRQSAGKGVIHVSFSGRGRLHILRHLRFLRMSSTWLSGLCQSYVLLFVLLRPLPLRPIHLGHYRFDPITLIFLHIPLSFDPWQSADVRQNMIFIIFIKIC